MILRQNVLNITEIFFFFFLNQLDVEKRKGVRDIIKDPHPTDGLQLCGAHFIPTCPSTAIPVFPLALQQAQCVCIHARAHPESAGGS